MSRAALILLLALVLALAGCGSGDDEQAAAPSPAPTQEPGGDEPPGGDGGEDGEAGGEPQAAPSPDGDGGIDPMPGAGTADTSGAGTGSGTALLQRAQLGRHEGFDRIVFEFGDHVPSWRVGYVQPPITEDGSGNRVDVAGNAYLQVRFEPASSYDLDAGRPTFAPRALSGRDAGTSVLREAVRTGDFEAVMTWVVGLSDRVDYRTQVLSNPPRLVVDVRNH